MWSKNHNPNFTYKNVGTELTFSTQQQDLWGKIVS